MLARQDHEDRHARCGVRSRNRCAPLAILVLVAMLVPVGSSAQTRWRSGTLQAGFAAGTDGFLGFGLSLAGEVGVFHHLRVGAQWTNWQALAGCGVSDAPSECNAQANLWELGLRQGIGVSPRVAPYVGAGFGLYRRRANCCDDDVTYSPYLSIGAGFDIRPKTSFTIRWSVVHQELFDHRVEEVYSGGVRFTGMLLGVGLSVW